MQVTKKDWNKKEFDWAKIETFYKRVSYWLNTACPYSKLEENLHNYLVDGISTEDITKMIIKSAIDLISPENTKWQNIAGRFMIKNLYKKWSRATGFPSYECYNSDYLVQLVHDYTEKELYNKKILETYSDEEIKELWQYINESYDLDYTHGTVNMYEKRYLIERNWEYREMPQHMYMVNAMFLWIPEADENRLEFVKNLYDMTASAEISLPTPTLLNARTPNSQLSSCFILSPADDLRSIYHNIENMAQISKNWWGLWVYMWNVRAKGSMIKWVYWLSWWTTPWIKVINDTGIAVNQMGKRAWAISVTLDIFHADIYSFLDLQTETWDIRSKSFDIFPAVSFPDLFFKRMEEGEQWTMFCPKEVEEVTGRRLQDHFWEEFDKFYEELEQMPWLKIRHTEPAKNLFKTYLKSVVETWMPYAFFRDTANALNPNKHAGAIYCSNLCVKWDTKIMTNGWYFDIKDLEGTKQTIWNWEEWSDVDVIKTNTDQELIKIDTSFWQSIECTPYHKFYNDKWEEIRAWELKLWDKLQKFELPIIHWTEPFMRGYENWFYSWDGCEIKNNKQRIYLYWEKKKLEHMFLFDFKENKEQDRLVAEWYGLQPKYTVPSALNIMQHRLDWLAWFADADGTITNNNWTESLQLANTNLDFLKEIQLMLQTLWVNAKITKMKDAWMQPMPKNDGSGENMLYECKAVYRLLITANWLNQLGKLWFKTFRLKWEWKEPQREANQFVKITWISEVEWLHDTYCFTEPKRNMGMFNGILTGNCTEIAQNQSENTFITEEDDDWIISIKYQSGDTVICNLASINIAKVHTREDFARVVPIAMRCLDNVIDLNAYPIKEAEITAKKYRAVWLWTLWVAQYFAENKLMYWTPESVEAIDEVYKNLAYETLRASVDLAKERWAYPEFEWSEFSKWIAFGRDVGYNFWPVLEEEMKEYWTRFGYHSAPAPNTSTGLVVWTSAWVVPIYKKYFVETNAITPTVTVAPNLSPETFWFYPEYVNMELWGVIDVVSAIQKWIDQSVSFEWMINPQKTSPADLYKYYMKAWKQWLKTIYYVRSQSLELDNCESCSG